jgi:hypothetical protein
MGVHEDTLRGLQEALDYVKGDKTKGRENITPEDDISVKYNKLPEEMKQIVRIIIDNALYAEYTGNPENKN